jgi:hypothetical protein
MAPKIKGVKNSKKPIIENYQNLFQNTQKFLGWCFVAIKVER